MMDDLTPSGRKVQTTFPWLTFAYVLGGIVWALWLTR